MFLDDIRSYLCKCLDSNYQPFNTNFIKCLQCGHCLNVYEFILNASSLKNNDPFLSSHLAHSYAEWTGNIHVPCEFLVKIDTGKILPTRMRHTSLSHLLKGMEILKALNYPFTDPRQEQQPAPNKKIFKNLMDEYMSLIDKVCCSNNNNNNNNAINSSSNNNSSESLALKVILTNMKSVFAQVDFFEQYFDVLVPYVKSRLTEEEGNDNWIQSIPVFPECNNKLTGLNLYREIIKSDAIRNKFSKYCIPFDVVYVMALCFICGDDMDLVYNLVLDLGARLCTRYFYDENNDRNEIYRFITKLLKSHASPTKNIQLYYLVQKFNQLQVEECFSSEFIKKFGELDHSIRTSFDNNDTNKLIKFKYQQSFPYVLFQGRDEDYYGFMMALAFYASKTNLLQPNAVVAKGLISNCKKIYRFIKNCILRVRQFEHQLVVSNKTENTINDSINIYWTRDTFNLFLCSDSNFENELVSMLGMMLNDNNDKNH